MSRSFSSVSSVLENSDMEEQQSGAASESNVNYDDEQFDSQSENEGESVAPAVVFSSSGSDNYGSDEFEDEQEAHTSVASFGEVVVLGDVENSGDYDDESFEEDATALRVQSTQQGEISQATDEGDDYVDESFEGEETTDEQEATVLGVQGDLSQVTNKENDYDDESFEGEDTTGEQDTTVLGAHGANQGNFSQATDEVNEYDDESFEGEEATSLGVQRDTSQASSAENDYDDELFEGEETIDDQDNENQQDGTQTEDQVIPETDVHPDLGDWCFKKIYELRSASSKPESSQPPVREWKSAVGKIPAAAVKDLIHRASSGLQRGRQRQQGGNSRLRSHQKLKMPASVFQRVQTQRWLAKASQSPEPPPTPTRSVVSTFCSVKCDVLRGRLATMRLSEPPGSTETGEFSLEAPAWVQKVAEKQREVANRATKDFGGRRLFEVEMATRLQLGDSTALRKQAATLLTNLTT
ncbi:hypothetical protein V7S43_018013 [Phytophthora oleae]|uniref:Uncharacterized protein n=1 Tax=Phytophthora oleae TaxID=2107226 RepID=A0ABD3EVN8_9STRA